ncbi:MAG TPA: hypothetical protein VHZ74_10615 [Bryobacteraceae bacterium]|nr:hypothetical protein [Bryobacteraceae bacterium]
MSSAAQTAAKKRAKTRGDFYCTRPPDVAKNGGVPHFAWLAQHALIMSYSIVLKAMWTLKPKPLPMGKDGRDRGDLLLNASIRRIQKETVRFTNIHSDAPGEPMPLRTVAHCLVALEKKKFIERWDVESISRTSSSTSPFGTNWRILRFDEILQQWADDSEIGTVGKRAFYVIGKGRRHLTPAELESWKLNHFAAEADPRAHARRMPVDEPSKSAPAPLPKKSDADLEELKLALLNVCGAADVKDARYLWGHVAQACGARPIPPVMDIASMVYAIRQTRVKTGNKNPITPDFVRLRIGGYVERWQLDTLVPTLATGTRGPRS